MSIRYYLQSNPGTPDPNDFYARISTRENLNEEQLADELAKRGGFASPALALAAIQSYQSLVAEKLAQGCAINTALCTYRPGITGVFHGPQDHFDPARHELGACFQAGPLLRRVIRAASVEKTRADLPAPTLLAFGNLNTGDFNASLTPGGIGEARGRNLNFGAQPGEGIYLINSATAAETRVATVAKKTRNRLTFLCPALPPGSYRLEVRRANADGTLRTGQLNELLTVA